MTQTNEDLREKIKELFNDHYWDSLSKDRDLILGHCYFIVDEIMSLIQQPEQLEIEVYPIFKELGFNNDFFKVVYKNNGVWKSLFCAVDEVDCVKYLQRHNLNLRKKDIYEKS